MVALRCACDEVSECIHEAVEAYAREMAGLGISRERRGGRKSDYWCSQPDWHKLQRGSAYGVPFATGR